MLLGVWMQIRKLQRRSGKATVSVWPPRVLSRSGTTFVRSGDGVLKRVTRVDNRLALTIECEGREAVSRLERGTHPRRSPLWRRCSVPMSGSPSLPSDT